MEPRGVVLGLEPGLVLGLEAHEDARVAGGGVAGGRMHGDIGAHEVGHHRVDVGARIVGDREAEVGQDVITAVRLVQFGHQEVHQPLLVEGGFERGETVEPHPEQRVVGQRAVDAARRG